MRGLYDNTIIAYKTTADQTVNLAPDTVKEASRTIITEFADLPETHVPSFCRFSLAYLHIKCRYGFDAAEPYNKAISSSKSYTAGEGYVR